MFARSPLSPPNSVFRSFRSAICNPERSHWMGTTRFTNGGPLRARKRNLGEREGRSCKHRIGQAEPKNVAKSFVRKSWPRVFFWLGNLENSYYSSIKTRVIDFCAAIEGLKMRVFVGAATRLRRVRRRRSGASPRGPPTPSSTWPASPPGSSRSSMSPYPRNPPKDCADKGKARNPNNRKLGFTLVSNSGSTISALFMLSTLTCRCPARCRALLGTAREPKERGDNLFPRCALIRGMHEISNADWWDP